MVVGLREANREASGNVFRVRPKEQAANKRFKARSKRYSRSSARGPDRARTKTPGRDAGDGWGAEAAGLVGARETIRGLVHGFSGPVRARLQEILRKRGSMEAGTGPATIFLSHWKA